MIDSIIHINPVAYISPFIAFLSGSIPFGVLFTRKRGIDLKTTGSRNIGATNVLRTAGRSPALLTLICDALKGAIPVILRSVLLRKLNATETQTEAWMAITGVSAVAGHMFSIFLSFKGGKGVATGLGVIMALRPWVAVLLLIIWVVVASITRYSSLASIISTCALPVIFFLTAESETMLLFSLIVGSMIIIRHHTNIKRLMRGEETKIGGGGSK